MSFFLLEVTKFALATFDRTELADELKESTHQTNFQMLSVFLTLWEISHSHIRGEFSSRQGNNQSKHSLDSFS